MSSAAPSKVAPTSTSTLTCLHSTQFPLNTDTPVFLPEKSHGQRSLVGYSPWSRKTDLTKRLNNNNHNILGSVGGVQFSSVTQSCLTLCHPMNHSTPGLPVHHQLPETGRLRLTSIKSVMPSSHLIICRPLLLLPPIPPSIRVFSNESTLHMRWPKYWSFSFSISPPKEHPGLMSFRMD